MEHCFLQGTVICQSEIPFEPYYIDWLPFHLLRFDWAKQAAGSNVLQKQKPEN